jgi:uncharacterized membrane protein YesL
MTNAMKRDFTQGPLFRAATAVYGMLGATVCFLVACIPFIAAMLLTRTAVLLVVAGFSIGPAWVAMLYVMRAYAGSRDIDPFRLFWRGYRSSVRQTLLFWVPYFALLMILGADVFAVPNTPAPVRWLIVVLGAIAVLWGSTVLLIIGCFSFRLRDVLRLAIYGLIRSPRWLVANVALMLVTGAIVFTWSEAAAGALVAPIALFTVLNSRGLFERLRAEFTAK